MLTFITLMAEMLALQIVNRRISDLLGKYNDATQRNDPNTAVILRQLSQLILVRVELTKIQNNNGSRTMPADACERAPSSLGGSQRVYKSPSS